MTIEQRKRECKIQKKYNNPKNLSLMQIQHLKAKELGYKNWGEMIKEIKK